MSPLTFVLLSGMLTFGCPLAFAVWELLHLPTFKAGGDEPPPEERFAPAPKPLPACLQPETLLKTVRVRVLEDA